MTLYDLFFPPKCPYCGELTGEVKESCDACSRLLRSEPHRTELECGAVCFSVFMYSDDTKSAVIRYKYRENKQMGKSFAITLARIMEDYIGLDNIDLITGVPAKKDTAGNRFDQIMFIMKCITKITDIQSCQTLRITRKTRFQHEMNRFERRENVRGLFRIIDDETVKDKRIIILDDVITTGSTLNECACELLRAGARSVICMTLAW